MFHCVGFCICLSFVSGGLLTYFWHFCESSPVQSTSVQLHVPSSILLVRLQETIGIGKLVRCMWWSGNYSLDNNMCGPWRYSYVPFKGDTLWAGWGWQYMPKGDTLWAGWGWQYMPFHTGWFGVWHWFTVEKVHWSGVTFKPYSVLLVTSHFTMRRRDGLCVLARKILCQQK